MVRIQEYPDREIAGTPVPAHEAMPGPESWGARAWTFTSEDKARAKFRALAE